MPPDATTALGLPRPNPDPLAPSGPGPLLPALTLLLATAWIVAMAWRALRRRPGEPHPRRPAAADPDEPTMPALAEAVRAAIVARLGEAWAARTREEIADAPEITDAYGPARCGELERFLADADRAKFADAPDQGAFWSDWVADFVAAGATSRNNGR